MTARCLLICAKTLVIAQCYSYQCCQHFIQNVIQSINEGLNKYDLHMLECIMDIIKN